MIRLFCDRCGKEQDDADATIRAMFFFTKAFDREWPVTYLCNSCHEEYRRKKEEFEKEIADREAAVEEAKKRLHDFEESYAKEEGA